MIADGETKDVTRDAGIVAKIDIATTNVIGTKRRRRMAGKRERLWFSKASFDVMSAMAGWLMKSDDSGFILAEYCRGALDSEDALVLAQGKEDLNQANNAVDDEY